MNPSDPLLGVDDFRWMELGDCDGDLSGALVTADGHTKRATAIARVASEVGCDFTDLSTRVKYVRSLTRQEAWDDYGRDQYDEWNGGPEEVPATWRPDETDYHFVYVQDPTLPTETEVLKVWDISYDR